MIPVTFKIQNRIYHVFQCTWSCHISFFCYMSNNKNSNPILFCYLHQSRRHFPYLRHRTRCSANFFYYHCLYRVNDHHTCIAFRNYPLNIIHVIVTQKKHILLKYANPFCTHLDLRQRFLPRDIEYIYILMHQIAAHL